MAAAHQNVRQDITDIFELILLLVDGIQKNGINRRRFAVQCADRPLCALPSRITSREEALDNFSQKVFCTALPVDCKSNSSDDIQNSKLPRPILCLPARIFLFGYASKEKMLQIGGVARRQTEVRLVVCSLRATLHGTPQRKDAAKTYA